MEDLLKKLSGPALVTAYNAITGEDLKRFSDNKAAIRRVSKALSEATKEQLVAFRKAQPMIAVDLEIGIPPELKHFNLRCINDNYMLKTNQICLEWARPACPVCGGQMYTYQERRAMK